MTRDEVCKIVCECLGDVAVAPAGASREECEEQQVDEIALGEEDIASLFACILEKLRPHGKGAILGKKMWKRAETVAEFCDAVHANLTRIG